MTLASCCLLRKWNEFNQDGSVIGSRCGNKACRSQNWKKCFCWTMTRVLEFFFIVLWFFCPFMLVRWKQQDYKMEITRYLLWEFPGFWISQGTENSFSRTKKTLKKLDIKNFVQKSQNLTFSLSKFRQTIIILSSIMSTMMKYNHLMQNFKTLIYKKTCFIPHVRFSWIARRIKNKNYQSEASNNQISVDLLQHVQNVISFKKWFQFDWQGVLCRKLFQERKLQR